MLDKLSSIEILYLFYEKYFEKLKIEPINETVPITTIVRERIPSTVQMLFHGKSTKNSNPIMPIQKYFPL